MHSSYLVSDPKGTLLLECGKLLERGSPKLGEDGKPVRKNGKIVYELYRIKVLNTINFKKSMKYNPFAYLHDEKDILKLVNTLIANTKAKQVIGVEAVPEAVEDAKRNAALNRITNARFLCGDAALAARQLAEEGVQPDVIVLDPPRKGCDVHLIDTVVNMAPRRVVYISCDPATLARDLKLFGEKRYETREATPVDLFPRTGHVETVALLSRG